MKKTVIALALAALPIPHLPTPEIITREAKNRLIRLNRHSGVAAAKRMAKKRRKVKR